jgi:miniconductance mechanosensitive channel
MTFAVIDKYDLLELMVVFLVILLMIISIVLLHKFINKIFRDFVQRLNNHYIITLDKHDFFRHLTYASFCLYLQFWGNLLAIEQLLPSVIYNIYNIILAISLTIALGCFLIKVVNTASELLKESHGFSRIPIELYGQIMKIAIMVCASIVIASYSFQISLVSLFTSFGAATAIITFVFKNSFESLIASLQLID